MTIPHRWYLVALTGALMLTAVGQTVCAQDTSRGFTTTLPAAPTTKDLLIHEDLWLLEVSFKPMRMRWIEITDPVTGKTEPRLIWYLVYKVVNRPIEKRADDTDSKPINVHDPAAPKMFIPHFLLVTNDNGVSKSYHDEILPEAHAAIEQRERRRGDTHDYLDSVGIMGPVPPATARGENGENAKYGIAMWSVIDPTTDYYSVYMSGFSSAYQIMKNDQGEVVTDDEGKPIILRKTIQQDYWRPGDRFDQNEREIRSIGTPKWIYVPDPATTPPTPANPPAQPPADS